MEFMAEIILPFLAANPHFAVLITFMSVSRAIFKPLCTLIEMYVKSTPSETDDAKWSAFQQTKLFRSGAYFVDFFLSIKMPKK